jgi:hypothetical protein
MRRFDILVIGLCVILALFFVGLIMYQFRGPDVKKLDMFFQVSDRMGFNTDTDALYFGKGYPGSVTKRQILLNNSHPYPVIVSIKVNGDISQFISVSENDFMLQPGEVKYVMYFLETAGDTPHGNYSGQSTFVFRKTQ